MVAYPGCYKSFPEINQYVTRTAQAAGFDPGAIYAIQLALDEACANIIKHAYQGEDRGEIECTCQTTSSTLTITLHDHGLPFQQSHIQPPNPCCRLKNCKTHGAGLFLMRKMMDEIHFEKSPDGGNFCVMVKRKSLRG